MKKMIALFVVLFVSWSLVGSEKRHCPLEARMSVMHMQKNFRDVQIDDLITYLQGLKIDESYSVEYKKVRPATPIVVSKNVFRASVETKCDSDSDSWDPDEVD